MLLNCGVGEDSWESLGQQDQISQSWRKSVLNIHWKDWCWSWSSNTLAAWCELIHWKRPWCLEILKAGGEGDDRGWDDCMSSPTQWTWFWVNSRRWWWTGRPDVLQSMGSQKVGHDWATELNWTDLKTCPTRLPGAQSASVHPELPQGLLKIFSYSSLGFNLRRSRWQMPLLFSHWQFSW